MEDQEPQESLLGVSDQLEVFENRTAEMDHLSQQTAKYGLSAAEVRTIMASRRADMAGTPTTMMLLPTTYQQKVQAVWGAYNSDPLFRRLIDRVCEFVANGSTWSVKADPERVGSWVDRIKKEEKTKSTEQQDFVWNHWASNAVNQDVPNIPTGLDEVTRWITKHMLLSGMCVLQWELGTVKMGSRRFVAPVKFTCWPASSTLLYRPLELFVNEEIHVYHPQLATLLRDGTRRDDPYTMQRDGDPIRTGGWGPPTAASYIHLKNMPTGDAAAFGQPGDTEAYCVKNNWSPGDVVLTGRPGAIGNIGQGVYPLVPFVSLLTQFAIRQKLFAADLAVLDGIINYLMIWKIGDKDNKPVIGQKQADGTPTEKSTIDRVKQLVHQGQYGQAMEIFLPYWVSLDVKMPESSSLVNSEKYRPSTQEILQAFGILFSQSASGSRERMERINMANFEEMLGALQRQIGLFYQALARRIMALNPGKLTRQPVWTPLPLNTRSEQFLQQLRELAKIGRVSTPTLMRAHGLSEDIERERMAQEQADDVDDLYTANTPMGLIQQSTVGPQADLGGKYPAPGQEAVPATPTGAPAKPAPAAPAKTKESRISTTMQKGRPSEGKPKKDGTD